MDKEKPIIYYKNNADTSHLATQEPTYGVTQKYNRKNYDSPKARKKYHDSQFGDKKTITDANGKTIHRSHKAAKKKYRKSKAPDHQGESDHIDPLKNIQDRHKENTLLTDQDIEEVGNRKRNLQELNKRDNTSKGASSEFEVGIKERNIKRATRGAKAQIETDVLLTGRSIKNGVVMATDSIANATPNAIRASGETALVALALSGISNLSDIAAGRKDVSEALECVAKDTACSAASGFGINLTQNVVADIASQCGANDVAIFIAQELPIAQVAVAVMTVNTVKRYLDGHITQEECAVEIITNGAGAVAFHLGMVAGGPAAAVVASIVVSQISNTIREYQQEKKIQRAREAEFNRVMRHAEAEVAHQYGKLIDYTSEELARWNVTIQDGFELIFQAALDDDCTGVAKGIDTILGLFNKNVLFPDIDSFERDFYDVNAAPLIL